MPNSFSSAFKGIGKDILHSIRERNNEHLCEAALEERIICIEKATSAMIELGIGEKEIIEMLQKYWDLRLSEAKSFIEECSTSD